MGTTATGGVANDGTVFDFHATTNQEPGPTTSNLTVTPSPTSTPPTISATISDAGTTNNNIVAAEYFIGTAGSNGRGTPLTGSFTGDTVTVSGTLTAAQFSAPSQGTYTIYVNGEDADANWGPTGSTTFIVQSAAPAPTISLTSPANGSSSTSTEPTLAATDGTAGIAFGDPPYAGGASGVAAQDLIVASYSVATNNLGITQPAPMAAQATTMVQSPPPVIIREQPLFASTKKRGLIGFSLTFKSALSSATANNAGNYQLDTVTTKKVKRKVVTILKRIGFRVSYDAAHETVDITMTGKQTFPHGGRLTVESGVTGVPVAGTTVFAISKAGRLITPSKTGPEFDHKEYLHFHLAEEAPMARKRRILRRDRTRRPDLEHLEIRLAPANFNPLTTTADGAGGSLRDDINVADSNGDASNTITLDAGNYTLTKAQLGPLLIQNTAPAPGVPSKTLTIVGNGAGQSIINTNKTTDGFYNRVFTIVGTSLPGNSGYSVKVVFKNLTVTGGEFLYPPASKTAAQGGGLSINGADVTLTTPPFRTTVKRQFREPLNIQRRQCPGRRYIPGIRQLDLALIIGCEQQGHRRRGLRGPRRHCCRNRGNWRQSARGRHLRRFRECERRQFDHCE